MDRKAKDKEYYSKLIDQILENTNFDKLPECACPINSFPNFMSVTFCITKCYMVCDNFKQFSFIIDFCSKDQCDVENPCNNCLQKISEFKQVMMQIKAIFPKRNNKEFIKNRVMEYIEWCNNLSEKLKKRRNND